MPRLQFRSGGTGPQNPALRDQALRLIAAIKKHP